MRLPVPARASAMRLPPCGGALVGRARVVPTPLANTSSPDGRGIGRSGGIVARGAPRISREELIRLALYAEPETSGVVSPILGPRRLSSSR